MSINHNVSGIFVSVLMLTYNHEKYISEAINGVFIQKTNFQVELIIANDNSPDNTDNIIRQKIKECPDNIVVNYICNEENIGANENFFNAMSAARGKYIALCEGDDYWTDPLKLQKQVDFLEKNEEYGMVHTDADEYDTVNKKMINNFHKTTNRVIPSGNILEHLLKVNYSVFTCTSLIRSKLFKSIQYPKNLVIYSGDTFYWFNIARQTKIKYFEESTAVRRLLLESASQSQDIRKLINFKKAGYNLYKFFIRETSCSEEIEKIIHAKFNKSLLALYYDADARKRSLFSFCNIIKLSGVRYLTLRDYARIISLYIPFGKSILNLFRK